MLIKQKRSNCFKYKDREQQKKNNKTMFYAVVYGCDRRDLVVS